MAVGLWVLLGWMFVVMVTALLFLAWAKDSGQLDNIEEAKYRMLEERAPEPWPEKPRKRKKGGQP